MDTLFPQKSDFISTKEAARLSSYHSDYLARLAKQNKIIGRQVGRTWLISWSSLERFAAEQESRKRARAGALSSERRSHYRAANAPSLPAPIGISADPPRPRPRPLVSPWSSLARSRLLALAVTCALLGASAAASAAPALPAFGAHAAALAVQSARGFSLLADEALAPVAARVAAAHAQERSASERAYARAQSVGGAPLAFGLAAPQLPRAPLALASPASPATSAREVPHAALSPSVRTLLAQAPQAVAAMNLALGEGVIAAAHGAIALEVRGIYATPGAARASARATTLALGDTGAALAFAAAQAPGVASALSAAGLRAAIALGESAAREFFGAEYALAERFLAVRDAALAADWQATWGAGALAAQGTLALSAAAAHLDAPAAEDLALGLLGRAAAALEAGSDRLAAAAALPSLSPLQKVALATYEYFNAIFAPPPGVAVVENATTTPAPIAIAPAPAAPAAAPAPRPVTLSYPSYTTVVNGVSQSYVDQAIATATNELEARMALLVAPVAAQSVVNETSIQEVNMIQSLSGLTVNDGTWNGGAISGATVDATALHADTAGIGLLSAGTTTLSGTIDATGYLLNGVPLSGSGTVTSVDADGGATGLTFSGGPVTTSGTLTLGGTLAVAAGGTGTSTAPGYGQLLLGNGAGGFDYVATSSLGIVGGSGSGILTGLGSGYATTTGAAITFATSSSAATGLTLGLSIVPAASSLAFNPSLGGTLAVAHGGTGTSSAPGYGQLLLGNGAGGFDYVATSSLGITAGTSFTANYPLALNAGVLSLAFGTSTSNTWGGTQIFTNAPILGSLTGLIYGSSGALHTAATSTAALGPGLSGTLTTLGAGDSLSIATSSLFGGSTGQVAYFSGADSIAGTSSITVAASGNVGVGTAAPTYPFEVDSATTNTALFLSSSNTLTDVAVKNSSAGGRDWQLLSIGANGFNSMTAGSFAIHDNSSGATRFDISPGGDIGIGTTSPFAKLSVAGSGYFDGALTSGNLTATGTVAFTGLGSGLVKSASGTLGLAADGTDYLSPSTLGGLFYDLFHATTTNALAEGSSNLYFTNARADARFITDLAATSSVSSITALPSLLLPYSQLTGTPSISGYPFALTGNATSTLTQFNGGLTALASSTIGNGSAAGGLTVLGGATTTGDAYFAGALGVGTDNPQRQIDIEGVASYQGGTAALRLGRYSASSYASLDYYPSYTTVSSAAPSWGSGFFGVSGNNGYNIWSYDGTSDSVDLSVAPTGLVGIGTTSPFAKLSVAGSGYFDGALTSGNLTATGTVAFTGLGSGLVYSDNGALSSVSTSTWTSASSTLLADSNTFSGADTFSSLITGDISGNAGTVTNGVYTSTFGGLFYDLFHATTTNALAEGSSNLYFTNARADARFITDLAATSSVSSITALPNLVLPTSQLSGSIDLASQVSGTLPIARGGTGTTTAPGYGQLLIGDASGAYQLVATSSLGIASGASYTASYPLTLTGTAFGLAFGTTTANAWSALQQFDGGASTTALTVAGTASTTALVVSNLATGSTECVQAGPDGTLSTTGAACGTGSGAVNQVTSSDGSLTISPTTGNVVANLALGHANAWSALQQFGAGASSSDFSANLAQFGASGTTTIAANGALTTPALTVGALSGLLKAASGVVGAASDGTDYLSPATFGAAFDTRLSATTTLPAITSLGNLADIGTITSGIWEGSTIGAAYGGTGSTTLSGLLKGNGTGALATALPDTDYQKPITLTTSGTSGAATFSGDTLNIPQYVDTNTTYTASYPLTLTGTAFGLAFGTTTANAWSALQQFESASTTLATLGTTWFSGFANALLSTDASGKLQSTTVSSPLSFTGSTLSLPQATASAPGYLSASDWTAFTDKVSSTSLSASYPLAYNSATGAFTYQGLATSSAWTAGDLAQVVNGNTITSIATSSLGIALSDTSGTLSVARGGTGQSSFAAGALLYGAGSGALQSAATSSISVGSGISVTSGALGAQVGGSNVTLGIAAGAITNAMLANDTISGIALGGSLDALSHDSTLSGTPYDGSAVVSDWGLNLAHANTWSALQQFANASTSQLSAGVASFGATATSTFAANGSLTLPSGAALTLGGLTSALLYANASHVLAGASVSSPLSFSSGALSLGTVGLGSGGTATTTFYNHGVVFSDGTKLTQSSGLANFYWDEANKRLGLGTSSPQVPLSIQINANGVADGLEVTNVSSGSSAAAGISAFNNIGDAVSIQIGGSNRSANQVAFANQGILSASAGLILNTDTDSATSGSDPLYVLAGGYNVVPTFTVTAGSPGNVGIGTTNPSDAALEIEANATQDKVPLALKNDAAAGYTQMEYIGTGATWYQGVGNASESDLGVANKYYLFDDASGDVALTVNGSDNLGIGTTSPFARLSVAGNAYIGGSLTATGTLAVGSGSGTSTFATNIGVAGNIVPSTDNTYTLGDLSHAWKEVFIGPGSLYVNGQEVIHTDISSNVNVTADTNQSLILKTAGSGSIQLNPSGTGNIQLSGPVQLTGGKTFTTSDSSAVLFSDGITAGHLNVADNAITATNLNGGISLTPTGNGGVYVTSGNFGIGTTSPSSALSVAGNAYLSGNLTAAGSINFNGSTTLTNATTTSLAITSIASKLLKTNASGSVVAAVAGTDYAPPTSGTSLLYGDGAGGFSGASVSSPLSFSGGALSLATVPVAHGGTGTTTAPGYGQLLIGDASGAYQLVATSSLGIAGSVTSVSSSDGTLTISPTAGAVAASLNLANANAWSALQNFANASATAFSASYASSTRALFGSLSVGALNGFLKAAAGSVSASLIDLGSDVTGVLSIAEGGTGTTTAPGYGDLLIGDASGNYELVSTSTLGFGGGSVSSVDASGGTTGLSFSGGPITGSGTLTLSGWLNGAHGGGGDVSGLLKGDGFGTVTNATPDGDYQLPLSADYPLSLSGDALSLAFGTTTSNTWSGTQTFTSTPVLGALTGFVGANGGNLYQIASSSLDLPNSALQNSSITVNGTLFSLGESHTIAAASSTLLADDNTFSGANTFSSLITGDISGNAGTASALATARSIAGVSFDGSADISLTSGSSLLKGNGSGGFANAAAGTDYENPLTFTYPLTRSTNTVSLAFGTTTSNTWSGTQTFASVPVFSSLASGGLAVNASGGVYAGATTTAGTGLTYSGGAFNVNTSQNISQLSNLASAGFVKTDASGNLSVDTTSYLSSAVTSLRQSYGTTQTGAITLATSSAASSNGITVGQTITNSGGTFTFTPTISVANIPNSALQNSSITVNGVSIALGSSGTVASTTLLADANTFSGTNTFNNTITGSISGNAGTVTNGVYTTTFGPLFYNYFHATTTDALAEGSSNLYFTSARATSNFISNLAATTSVASITTLPSLSLPTSQITGTLGVAHGGTGSTTLTGLLKGNGTGGVQTAVAGTDYQAPITIGNLTVGSNLSVSGGTGAVIGSGASISLGANVVTGVTNDTNITGSISSNNLTLGWTGILAAGRGGTGIGSPTAAGILLGSYAGGAWQQLATSSLGIALSDTTGTLAVNRGGTGQTSFAAGLLYSNGTSFSSISTSTWTFASSTLLADDNTFSGANTFSSLITGDISGNAGTASALATARSIAGVSFDGSADISLTSGSSLLKGNGSGGFANAAAGTDYENPLTFTYPLTRSTNTVSLAFGTTTSNTWSALQQFANASTSQLSAGVASFGATATSTFAANGSLTLPSGAALTLTGNTSHLLRTDGSGTVSSVTIGTGLSFDGATLIATSGGGGSVATSSAETAGQLAYWTTTAGTPATLGTIATSSVALASPLSYSGTLGALVGGAGGTLSIANAKADGSTVGAATFSTSGFNDNGSGLISLDYANGQKADGAQPGYLASSDWTLFNNKISSTSLSASYPLSYNSATGAFIFTGLSTSTVPVVGNIPYYSGANTFANVATSSAVLGSEFSYSGTLGALVGGAGGTLHITGGGVTNAMLQNSTISGVALGNALGALTATNGTLTFSGSYNGSAAQTVGLNLGSANAWSALQQFGGGLTAYASSTIGNGSTTGGLTVNGNATTTGSVYAAGTLAVGTNVPADLITASNPSGGGITVIDTGTNGATWSVDTTDDAWCAKGSKLIFLANEGNSCDATLTLLTSGSVGIGTTTPTAALSVVGEGSSGDALTVANTDTTGWSDVALLDANGAQQATLAYANAGSSVYADSLVFESNAKNIIFGTGLGSNERMRITAGGNIGIGTTSPGSLLSVGDTGGINFGTATSTFSTTGGINLASGCFAINGTCISGGVVGGSGTVGSGSTGQFPYYAGGGTTLTATSSLFLAASGNIGIGTTSPIGKFAIQTAVNQAGAFTISNAIGSTTLQFDTLDNSTSIFTVATSTGTAYFNVGASGTITISGLAAAAGAFIAADPSGNLIATTTPGGSGGVGSGTIGQLPYYAANGTTLTATSSLFLAASGNIGIGTTSPYARLSVMAGGDYASHAVSTLFAISSSSAGTATSTLFSVDSTGLTTVGDSSGTGDAVFQFAADSNAWAVGYKSSDKSFNIASSTNLSGTAALSIAKNGNATFSGSGGTCVINGSGACTSDERLKSDIKDISGSDALAKLALISGITYTWADPSLDQSQRVGVLAQQVLSAFPQLVGSTTVNFKGTPGNYYTVDYAGLTAPLISAVNQLNGVYDAGGASTTQPTLRSFYHGAALPALSVDAVGNVAIATTTSAYRLAIAGSAYAESYAAPQGLWTGYLSSMGLGTTTVGSAPPSAVLTANGAVDVYKLAAYNAGSIAALASRIALDETRITSLESRVTALENGTVSDGGFSSSTLADALQSVGAFIQNGIAQFGTLVADRFVAASDSAGNSSAGSSAVLAGNTVVEVDNVYAHPDSKILVTFTSPISGGWYLSQKNEGSFRVTLNQPQLYDSTFDYFIIETSGQIATSTAPVGEEASSTSQRLPAGEEASSMPPAPPAPPADEEEASSTPPAGGDDEASSTPVLPPTIALIGAAAMQLSVGDSWSDPGATATASDGVTDLTSAIVETGAVDTATPALYILTYAVTDPDGASAQVSRAVSVLAPAPTAQNAATSTPSTDEGVASSTAPADTASSAAP